MHFYIYSDRCWISFFIILFFQRSSRSSYVLDYLERTVEETGKVTSTYLPCKSYRRFYIQHAGRVVNSVGYPVRDQISFSSILSKQNVISMQTPDQQRKLSSLTRSQAETTGSSGWTTSQDKGVKVAFGRQPFLSRLEWRRIRPNQDKGRYRPQLYNFMAGQITKQILRFCTLCSKRRMILFSRSQLRSDRKTPLNHFVF